MQLKKLNIQYFRAHQSYDGEFAPGINVITGPNGIGKTNLLESIHYLCLTRSFATSRDNACVQTGAEYFHVQGAFLSDDARSYSIVMRYSRDDGKVISVNKVKPERAVDHVGRFPIVVFSPDDYALTAAGPDERRRFLDNMLCQAYKSYMSHLLEYKHALRQRNALLQSGQRSPEFYSQLEAWSIEVVKHGSRIIQRRHTDMRLINKYLHDSFEALNIEGETPSMHYRNSIIERIQGGDGQPKLAVGDETPPQITKIEDAYFSALVDSRGSDIARRRTALGPHRDELELVVNNRPLRNYASQGQHRTFAMALKFAQYHYLHELTEEKPIVLLDDAFDHLDPSRISSYVRLVGDTLRCQTFITTANPGVLDSAIDYANGNKRIELLPSTVEQENHTLVNPTTSESIDEVKS